MKTIAQLITLLKNCNTQDASVRLINDCIKSIENDLAYTQTSPYNVLKKPKAMINTMINRVQQLLKLSDSEFQLPPHYQPAPSQSLALRLYLILTKVKSTPLPFQPNCLTRVNSRYSLKLNDKLTTNKYYTCDSLHFSLLLKEHAQSICSDEAIESITPPSSNHQKNRQRVHLLKQGYRFLIHYLSLVNAHQALLHIHAQYKPKKIDPEDLRSEPSQCCIH